MLTLRHRPDYLLILPMGVDAVGEREVGRAAGYLDQARLQDVILANLMPGWLELGYTVIVAADHGVPEEGRHGGTSDVERGVPVYLIGALGGSGGETPCDIPQCVLRRRPVGCSASGRRRRCACRRWTCRLRQSEAGMRRAPRNAGWPRRYS